MAGLRRRFSAEFAGAAEIGNNAIAGSPRAFLLSQALLLLLLPFLDTTSEEYVYMDMRGYTYVYCIIIYERPMDKKITYNSYTSVYIYSASFLEFE